MAGGHKKNEATRQTDEVIQQKYDESLSKVCQLRKHN